MRSMFMFCYCTKRCFCRDWLVYSLHFVWEAFFRRLNKTSWKIKKKHKLNCVSNARKTRLLSRTLARMGKMYKAIAKRFATAAKIASANAHKTFKTN